MKKIWMLRQEGEEVTNKERVLLQRGAAQAMGLRFMYDGFTATSPSALACEVSRMFPLPKVQVPRIAKDPHADRCWWSAKNDKIYWSCAKNMDGMIYPWDCRIIQSEVHMFSPTPERVKLWANLLANPTEEIEE